MSQAISKYAAWVSKSDHDVPKLATDRARDAVIDTFACMIAGCNEPVVRKLLTGLSERDQATPIIGTKKRLGPQLAALINGTSAHALDYDDNFDPALAHASAVLVASLLSSQSLEELSGRQFLRAYIVGLEVMANIGLALNPHHREIGWHATSTLGAIGASAACCHAKALDAESTANALSLAVSMAGGTTVQFGYDAKPIHAGLAARAGVESSEWAELGVSANHGAFDEEFGLRDLFAMPLERRERLFDSLPKHRDFGLSTDYEPSLLGKVWSIEQFGLLPKRSANCGSAHGLYETLGLEALDVSPGEIATIDIHIPRALRKNLRFDRPSTPAEAKFSASYAVALALKGKSAGLGAFLEEQLSDPDLISVVEKTDVIEATDLSPHESAGRVEIKFTSGAEVSIDCKWEDVPGSKIRPFDHEMLRAKLQECVAWSEAELDPSSAFKALRALYSESSMSEILVNTGL